MSYLSGFTVSNLAPIIIHFPISVYFETGSTGTAGSLSIAKGTDAGNRAYDIKVTYFTCDNLAKYVFFFSFFLMYKW